MVDKAKMILVIDDEEGACDFIKTYLEDRDYPVITTTNGKEGLELIKEKKPALTFLDIRMPEMNGIDVLTELKNQNISANIIIMTGLEEGEQLEKVQQFNIKGILKKPVQLRELSEVIKANI